jgi:hypothetical protein
VAAPPPIASTGGAGVVEDDRCGCGIGPRRESRLDFRDGVADQNRRRKARVLEDTKRNAEVCFAPAPSRHPAGQRRPWLDDGHRRRRIHDGLPRRAAEHAGRQLTELRQRSRLRRHDAADDDGVLQVALKHRFAIRRSDDIELRQPHCDAAQSSWAATETNDHFLAEAILDAPADEENLVADGPAQLPDVDRVARHAAEILEELQRRHRVDST